jgi:Cu2+-exporting ATPase
VVFDKTGTLTEGQPRLVDAPDIAAEEWSVAAALGAASRHPLARALARAAAERGHQHAALSEVAEHPGEGMSAVHASRPVRLGRSSWTGGAEGATPQGLTPVWLRIGDAPAIRFGFEDTFRSDAAETVTALKRAGLTAILLSGDREEAVAAAARRVGLDQWHSAQSPADKAAFLSALGNGGRRVLMVGDGLNDAPALATAFVSMSPANAADISQTAAAIVFTGRQLAPVITCLETARTARRLILQNFVLAIGYNLIAVPVAVAGLATPLVAAVAMSTSSILVTGNALRLTPIARRAVRKVGRRAETLVEAAA